MKSGKKTLLILLCIALALPAVTMGTLAWLTDSDSAANTFTVGRVDISVDEAKVNPDGTPVEGVDRVKENQYHLIPGQSYIKDPTMTVKADSEESYVRMLVTINYKSELDAIFAPGVRLDSIFGGWDPAVWPFFTESENLEANTVTYEFRYSSTVDPVGSDAVLEPLFTSFTIPGTVSGEDLQSVAGLTITVEGHAIQAAGFENADAAWAAFDQQLGR